jgi:hypothetical protein
VERFSDGEGRPCPRFAGHVRDNLLGWEAQNPDDPACTHDTLYEGLRAGTLEMHWSATLPADGSYDLVALGYSVGAWGRVLSRGSYYGDYWTRAQVVIEVRLRLVGEANRGKIDVDWFGFSALSDDEVHRIFGVRPRG